LAEDSTDQLKDDHRSETKAQAARRATEPFREGDRLSAGIDAFPTFRERTPSTSTADSAEGMGYT
jgi:hypothetical protein